MQKRFTQIIIYVFKKQKRKGENHGKITMFMKFVPYSNQKCNSVKWVCSVKETINGPQKKVDW